jgi:predicted TIM-barrel fold metal-dependent hydrolase
MKAAATRESARLIDFRIQPPWRWTDADPEVAEGLPGYSRVYGAGYKQGHSYEQLVSELRRLGIQAVVHAEPTKGEARAWNDRVHETMRRDPDRFVAGFCAGDPRDIMGSIGEIDRCYHELGLRGLSIVCDFYNIDLSDKRCYPLYAKAAALGMPVALHVGVNFTSQSPMRHGHPQFVDEIACHFPDLVLICCHGGWPWATEMAAVAWKHANVYLEFGAVSPKYIAANGGWDSTNHFMNSVLQDRILFGSDWPMLSHERIMQEIDFLKLKPAVAEKYLHGNAESLLERMRGGNK